MTDFFEVLGLPRQGTIDEAELQTRYHELAADIHPDKTRDPKEREDFAERSSQLNLAVQTLKNPVTRLRHLLELLAPGEKPDAGLSEDLMQLFALVGGKVQEADAFLAKKRAASSALAKALLAEAEIRTQQDLQATLGQVTEALNQLDLDASDLNDLRKVYTQLSFLNKWQRQLNERLLAILTGD